MVEVDNAKGWNNIVNALCTVFELPDLSKRAGLEAVHANFDAIYARIDQAYRQSLSNNKIRGGIIGIFSKLCVDAILRNKLFDKGILEKILPLLDIDETRHLALNCLNTLTNHGGSGVRIAVSKHANDLCKLVRDLPDDIKVAELIVLTLAHSLETTLKIQSKAELYLESVDMEEVIFTMLDSVRRPYALPGQLLDHALEILAASTRYSANIFKAHPRLIAFLVAGLQAKDWDTRWMCFSGIYDKDEDDAPLSVDPVEFLENISQTLPWNLQRALDTYGASRSDISLALSVSEEYDSAMRDRIVHGDLYAFGLKKAELILKADISIADGILRGSSTWMNSWRSAINKIRAKDMPEDKDAADILDIANLLYHRSNEEAVALARESITRNPEQAYFYYALSFSSDHVERLQAEKKGLKCQQNRRERTGRTDNRQAPDEANEPALALVATSQAARMGHPDDPPPSPSSPRHSGAHGPPALAFVVTPATRTPPPVVNHQRPHPRCRCHVTRCTGPSPHNPATVVSKQHGPAPSTQTSERRRESPPPSLPSHGARTPCTDNNAHGPSPDFSD
ncbi:unnamed protein product [Cyclocybe aegerita]|uniref:Uncharacterized protein n=1 Tax=Cyclocybe aegerita TaxID=1973307 RepID=A0A8S0VXQ3_CYCAE|nr:unnamed protein product [Cyclocybe aegerita]